MSSNLSLQISIHSAKDNLKMYLASLMLCLGISPHPWNATQTPHSIDDFKEQSTEFLKESSAVFSLSQPQGHPIQQLTLLGHPSFPVSFSLWFIPNPLGHLPSTYKVNARPCFRLCFWKNPNKVNHSIISVMGNPTWDADSVEQGLTL